MANITVHGMYLTVTKSKRMVEWFKAYNKSNAYCLDDVYGTCSTVKYRVEKQIWENMEHINRKTESMAYGYKIIAHSSMFFTVGYLMEDENGTLLFVVETASNRFCCSWHWLFDKCLEG